MVGLKLSTPVRGALAVIIVPRIQNFFYNALAKVVYINPDLTLTQNYFEHFNPYNSLV